MPNLNETTIFALEALLDNDQVAIGRPGLNTPTIIRWGALKAQIGALTEGGNDGIWREITTVAALHDTPGGFVFNIGTASTLGFTPNGSGVYEFLNAGAGDITITFGEIVALNGLAVYGARIFSGGGSLRCYNFNGALFALSGNRIQFLSNGSSS